MKYNISNTSNLDFGQIRPFLKSFLPFARQNMGYNRPVAINFVSDPQNAQKTLGKTAFYDPNSDSISIYTDNRHPKDILRSLSHELVHHAQNCRGDFDKKPQMGEDYFQYDKHMQEMEREAYEKGNMTFRDWEEKHRKQLQESIYYRTGDTKMNHNEWKNQAIFGRLMESFGYKAPKNEDISHLCATLVTEKKTGRVGHPINHTLLENGTVTHYDVEFDDVIVEGMPVDILEVEVQQEHMHAEDREDYEHGDKPRKKYMEEEKGVTCEEVHPGQEHNEYLKENELEEAHCGRREDDLDERAVPHGGPPSGPAPGAGKRGQTAGAFRDARGRREDEEEEIEEGAKPDFLDLDKDGDKKEPMKKAAKDAKKVKTDEATIREAVRKAIKKAIL